MTAVSLNDLVATWEGLSCLGRGIVGVGQKLVGTVQSIASAGLAVVQSHFVNPLPPKAEAVDSTAPIKTLTNIRLPGDVLSAIFKYNTGKNHAPINTQFAIAQAQHNRLLLTQVTTLPQFKVITEELQSREPVVSASTALKEIAEHAKTQMSAEQYSTIRAKYDGPLCIAFFQELNDTIRLNHDKATIALGRAINIPGIDHNESIEVQAQTVRTWLNNPANEAAITAVHDIQLQHRDLKVVPKELAQITNLRELYLGSNQLTSVELPDNMPALHTLDLSYNQLTELTLPNNMPALESLYLSYNQLTELTLPANMPALAWLTLYNNQLTELTLPANMPALAWLTLYNNQLTSVELPNNMPALYTLYLSNNRLTELTLPDNMPALELLRLENNRLTELTLPDNMPALRTLYLSNNQLTRVQLPANMPALEGFNLSRNNFSLLYRLRLWASYRNYIDI